MFITSDYRDDDNNDDDDDDDDESDDFLNYHICEEKILDLIENQFKS